MSDIAIQIKISSRRKNKILKNTSLHIFWKITWFTMSDYAIKTFRFRHFSQLLIDCRMNQLLNGLQEKVVWWTFSKKWQLFQTSPSSSRANLQSIKLVNCSSHFHHLPCFLHVITLSFQILTTDLRNI
jgi:hypothetical protein